MKKREKNLERITYCSRLYKFWYELNQNKYTQGEGVKFYLMNLTSITVNKSSYLYLGDYDIPGTSELE